MHWGNIMSEYDEYIDKSQWLPLKVIKEYAEYAVSNGRKVFNNGSIISSKKDKAPIDRLYEDERIIDRHGNITIHPILQSHHRDAGRAFKNLCDIADGKIIISDTSNDNFLIQTIAPELKRAAIYYQLNNKQSHFIDRVLFDRVGENDYRWMSHYVGTMQMAFQALFEAMKTDAVLTAIREIQKIELAKNNHVIYNTHIRRSQTAPKFIVYKAGWRANNELPEKITGLKNS